MDKTCLNLTDLDNNLGCTGNAPGIFQKLIFGWVEDVAVWPTRPTGTPTALSLEAAGGLVGDVVMKDGKRAFSLEFTQETGNLKIAPSSVVDGYSVMYTLAFIKAKIAKKILGFMNAASSKKMFIIAQDENGTWYLLGDAKRGVTLGGDGADTGTSGDDRNGVSLTATYRDTMALVYEGDVEDLLLVGSITPDPTSLVMTGTTLVPGTATINVGAAYLSDAVVAVLDGNNASLFSKAGTLTVNGGVLTITYTPTAIGSHSAILRLSAGGAAPVEVAITATAAS